MTMEDVWSGPREEWSDIYIKWRAGYDRLAGLPGGSPSTLRYCSRQTTDGKWVQPSWDTMWFPRAFAGVMEQLQYALMSGSAPMLSATTI